MRSDRALRALFDIRDNIRLAASFVEGFDFDRFVGDVRTFYAVTRRLEIISEAARRLPESLRSKYAALPWRAIMDAGNMYRHEYDNVAAEFVWRTVQHSLAPLLAVVLTEIDVSDSAP